MANLTPMFPQFNKRGNSSLRLMGARLGAVDKGYPNASNIEGVKLNNSRLIADGGTTQQSRMNRSKLKSLDSAVYYSYQGAIIKKYIQDYIPSMENTEPAPVRCLINPNKLKLDYDDKILSVRFDHNLGIGDVFEWCGTNSYWLIYSQELTETAYFRGDIRRCRQQISWIDEDGNKKSTFVAIRGPVETKIKSISKHQLSIDKPNYSLNILMPKNKDNLLQFRRYNKFYLTDLDDGEENKCWRVEAVDTISTPGIIEISAVEYYKNNIEDEPDKGLVGSLIVKPIDPNTDKPEEKRVINGPTFIKPKITYNYVLNSKIEGSWYCSQDVPVKIESFTDENGFPAVSVKWMKSYNGQFDLWYGDEKGPMEDYNKTIVVESLL